MGLAIAHLKHSFRRRIMSFNAVLDLATLDGSNGFVLPGTTYSYSGSSVSGAGDVNGDGFDDFLIGAPYAVHYYGASYVVFGSDQDFAASFTLEDLNGSNGFTIYGDYNKELGRTVAGAGDFNGDGIDDLLVSAPCIGVMSSSGPTSYVIWGSDQGFPAAVSATMSGVADNRGFANSGVNEYDGPGWDLSGIGDINGDGFDDLIIGAPSGTPDESRPHAGQSYVLFGSAQTFPDLFYLPGLDGSNGFVLNGVRIGDIAGVSVSGVGDFNGDGFDDLIVGASGADANGNGESGESYVVFGSAQGFPARFDLATLDGSNGFVLSGRAVGDRVGSAVSGAGDFNGDGFDDLIIGAPGTDSYQSGQDSGEVYVVFGSDQRLAARFDLVSLDGNDGFAIAGLRAGDRLGSAVNGAGDINGDGFDDIIITAPHADPDGNTNAGESYVMFGSAQGFSYSFDLATLDGSNGFVLRGQTGDFSGMSVSGAGDLNRDGFGDILIGAPEPGGEEYAGKSYVVFGLGNPGLPLNGATFGDDVWTGTDGRDVLFARTGDDQARGLAGNDRLAGQADDDRLYGGDGNDRLLGGRGNDTLSGGRGNDQLIGSTGMDRLLGNAGSERLVGGAGADQLIGGSGNDTLLGGTGRDRLQGNGGNDRLRGNRDADWLAGGAGDDRLFGGTENDHLKGQSGNDVLRGGRGMDVLHGGPGNDRLYGEPGNDRIVTGDGRDRIFIRPGQGRDIVTDFEDGFDRIVLGGGIRFEQLSIRQSNNDVLISWGTQRLLVLQGLNVEQMTAADFA